MSMILQLSAASLIPVFFSVLFCLLQRRTGFGRLKPAVQQVIIGVVFGGIAVLGTEFGVDVGGATANARDAAPLCAGLIFGGPAGIIAGLIGGVERWFAVYWGAGQLSRLACSVSTAFAGFYAAFLRKYFFEKRIPSSLFGFVTGGIMEVLHLTILFMTNLDNPLVAFNIVKIVGLPMILINAIAVALAALSIRLLLPETRDKRPEHKHISDHIQSGLLILVVFAFFLTTGFMAILQTSFYKNDADELLQKGIQDIRNDLSDLSRSGKLFSDEVTSADKIIMVTRNRHIGESGYVIIANSSMEIISSSADVGDYTGEAFNSRDIASHSSMTRFTANFYGEKCYAMYLISANNYIIVVLPLEELMLPRDMSLYINSFMEVFIFGCMFFLIYLMIKQIIVDKLGIVAKGLARISAGQLDEDINVRNSEEFSRLSDDINSTVESLKGYIHEAETRMAKELEMAKTIQYSALPSVFPAFPQRKDFDIYAMMDAAKEVGGDFYDFYLTDKKHLCFLVADVSGKGIPAALFMMRSKTLLKSLTESSLPLDEVFTRANTSLIEGNEGEMFVTSWMGRLDLATGVLEFVNAGHNPPLLKHSDGTFRFYKSPASFVLAGMDDMLYRKQTLQLDPGDTLVLYTDGVTEAINTGTEEFGNDRLMDFLNSREFDTMEDLCKSVRGHVADFVGEAAQFDDITLMGIRYDGQQPFTAFRRKKAAASDIPELTEQVEEALEELDCPMKEIMRVDVAIDEVYSNIVNYAYGEAGGPVYVRITPDAEAHSLELCFVDSGKPYDPLKKPDPDIEAAEDERTIGGLGIYMVKNLMNEVSYRYQDGRNVLTLKKSWTV